MGFCLLFIVWLWMLNNLNPVQCFEFYCHLKTFWSAHAHVTSTPQGGKWTLQQNTHSNALTIHRAIFKLDNIWILFFFSFEEHFSRFFTSIKFILLSIISAICIMLRGPPLVLLNLKIVKVGRGEGSPPNHKIKII